MSQMPKPTHNNKNHLADAGTIIALAIVMLLAIAMLLFIAVVWPAVLGILLIAAVIPAFIIFHYLVWGWLMEDTPTEEQDQTDQD